VRWLATTETGSGPAVLLVHGLNGFKEGWGRLPDALAGRGLRVVGVDLPGFGGTPGLARTTPQALARAIEPLMSDLAPVHLVGHSLGAQVAMIAAAERRERVGGIALLAPWVLARPRRLPPRRISDVLQLPVVGRHLARPVIARARRSPERRRDAYLSTVGDPAALTADPAMAALLEDASERLATGNVRAMADWAAAGLALDVRPLARRVPGPALVAVGSLDRVTPPPGARWLADALPGGRLLTLPGIGHFPHLEAPEAIGAGIADHLVARPA
jgi:pimeloyl-ACP methyl ester carboxylesterase